MRIRTAKKIGRSLKSGHRRGTVMRAANTFIMRDVRRYGWPGNMDVVMLVLWGYPNFGGMKNPKQEKTEVRMSYRKRQSAFSRGVTLIDSMT